MSTIIRRVGCSCESVVGLYVIAILTRYFHLPPIYLGRQQVDLDISISYIFSLNV